MARRVCSTASLVALLTFCVVGGAGAASRVTPPTLILPFPAGQSWQANGPHADNGVSGTRAFVDLGPLSGNGTVVAAMSGTVHNRTCVDGKGVAHKYAEVTSGSWATRYRHLKSFSAVNGSKVQAGQAIGKTGGDLTS